MILYHDVLSSASVRLRIALNLKGVAAERRRVNLAMNQQMASEHLARNPQGLVPVLVDGARVLTQSLAIIEYLDETIPKPALLPARAADRARVRGLAEIVACDIHPIGNMRVRRYIVDPLGYDDAMVGKWFNHWIAEGLAAFERLVADDVRTGDFCHGDTPGIADICLFPQMLNAYRSGLDMTPYPTLRRIFDNCAALAAFEQARPEHQEV
ncbi:MAG: maiA [Rhodospirillales bacterium]|nr:maiA [Rhodospirillales bacterium]